VSWMGSNESECGNRKKFGRDIWRVWGWFHVATFFFESETVEFLLLNVLWHCRAGGKNHEWGRVRDELEPQVHTSWFREPSLYSSPRETKTV
jgi:hypothetical protein